jgi:hypothetical protein
MNDKPAVGRNRRFGASVGHESEVPRRGVRRERTAGSRAPRIDTAQRGQVRPAEYTSPGGTIKATNDKRPPMRRHSPYAPNARSDPAGFPRFAVRANPACDSYVVVKLPADCLIRPALLLRYPITSPRSASLADAYSAAMFLAFDLISGMHPRLPGRTESRFKSGGRTRKRISP